MIDDTFAFILHPLDARRDAARKFPALAYLPSWMIELLSVFAPPLVLSEISGVRSCTVDRELRGWFIACPLSARMMMKLPEGVVYRKVIQSGKLAERIGARIVGLGAFTSVVGDGGQTIAKSLKIPVTTGNSYTIATAMQAVRDAAALMEIMLQESTVAVVGASGSIGSVCARLLAPDTGKLILIGRHRQGLEPIARDASDAGATDVQISSNVDQIRQAQIVITVTSDPSSVIESQHLSPGTIVCDVARPRDVAQRVSQERPDVMVIEGGVVRVPGAVNFGFDFGFPSGMAYACMAETMALALERRYESFTLGKRLDIERVKTIDSIASRHGFKVDGLRSLDKMVAESRLAGARTERLFRHTGNGYPRPASATQPVIV